MVITALKQQQKNADRVSIFIDKKYSFSLTLDQLLEYKLKKGDEVSDERLKSLKKLSADGKLRARALEWTMNRPHSTKELRDYLYRKQADNELRDSIVVEFLDKRYVNDESFARWFAENRLRKHKSSREITAELASKGIKKEIAETVLKELGVDDADALHSLVTKLRGRPRYADEQKLISYLQRKGFRYTEIREQLDQSD